MTVCYVTFNFEVCTHLPQAHVLGPEVRVVPGGESVIMQEEEKK